MESYPAWEWERECGAVIRDVTTALFSPEGMNSEILSGALVIRVTDDLVELQLENGHTVAIEVTHQ